MEELNGPIADWLAGFGWSKVQIDWTTRIIVLAGIIILSWLTTKLFRNLVIPVLQRISRQTKATWDDYLFNDRMMRATARLIPPIIWYMLLGAALHDMPVLLDILRKACLIYLIVAVLMLISAFLDTLYEISTQHEALRNRPLKGIYQMIKLVAFSVGAILVVSILIGRDATSILAGLGASAAVLMLIFRDSILGLVAGVQLSANDMLRPGDWITMQKYGADGYVTEVTLTTVKIQNFDKTITTIPPYALVSDSFQNWRGMRECGGRRIKRSLSIDADTVRFCTAEELAALRDKGLLDEKDLKNEQHPVNLQVFRDYIRYYMKHNPGIHADMMQMVRMLQPTPEGLPLEVYCFSRTTEWIAYEALQSEIFDHLLAVLPEFGLRVFQRPSGDDVRQLREKIEIND
ncbi:mechanosensitive ion channel family protein [Alistipes sp.]|uniref:mechanosensitive ion channel family protein n=1 Tax=Alistipes sp. TaxID=1872444 RepID=UPI003A8A5399